MHGPARPASAAELEAPGRSAGSSDLQPVETQQGASLVQAPLHCAKGDSDDLRHLGDREIGHEVEDYYVTEAAGQPGDDVGQLDVNGGCGLRGEGLEPVEQRAELGP